MFRKKINVLVLGADGMLGYDVYNHLLFLSRSKFSNIGSVAKITLEDKIDLDNTNYLYQYFNTSIHLIIVLIVLHILIPQQHKLQMKVMHLVIN